MDFSRYLPWRRKPGAEAAPDPAQEPRREPNGAADHEPKSAWELRTTELPHAELVKSHDALLGILENVSHALWSVDRDFRVLYINRYFREAFGTNWGVIPERGDSILDPLPAELAARWRSLYERALAGERVHDTHVYEVGGETLHYDVSLQPLVGPDGIYGAAVLAPDVTALRLAEEDRVRAVEAETRAQVAEEARLRLEKEVAERRRAEEALRDSEARLRGVFSSNMCAIAFWTYTGTFGDPVVEANDAWLKLVGYSVEDMHAGRITWEVLQAPEYLEADRRGQREIEAYGACVPYEKEFVRKDGSRVPILCGGAMIGQPSRDGVRQGVAFAIDLTERKRAEREKEQLQRQLLETQKLESLGVLAGGISHDFNNLLTGILGNASLALLSRADPAAVREPLEQVVNAAERASDLTRQLLAYAGKGQFEIRSVDLSRQVGEIHKLLSASISKKVEIQLALEQDLPPVEVDVSQIQQLAMNLALNGAEAIGDEVGTVTLATGEMHVDEALAAQLLGGEVLEPGPHVFLEVRDTGCGMPPEVEEKIFDPFFSTKSGGHGLGLAAALGIVRGHRGALQIHSEPGRGTRFRVLFPRSSKAASQVHPSPKRDLSGAGVVLVIDDEQLVLNLCARILKRYGYEVLGATNGRRGLEVFAEHQDRIDLVLLDMTMPVMDGGETFRELRRQAPEVKVILSSGYDELEATRRFVSEGLAGFIQKPYDAEQLASKVQEILQDKDGHADD
ncbi:MAG: response regulator [Proteobacteria bacterium]|nr:response regulator [Pseudomonadota bacterium]